MSGSGKYFRHFRLRHGLTQSRFAMMLNVPQRRLAGWERGEEEPSQADARKLVDLSRALPADLLASLSASVVGCPLPRALSRTERLNLRAVSGPAIDKRPSIVNWVGCDLLPLACGVLQSMLDDSLLQRAIRKGEVTGVVTTSRGVLRTVESETIGTWRTSISYFFHDGVLHSDAVALSTSAQERIGYTPIMVDELGSDLFGDRDDFEAALLPGRKPRA